MSDPKFVRFDSECGWLVISALCDSVATVQRNTETERGLIHVGRQIAGQISSEWLSCFNSHIQKAEASDTEQS